MPTYVCWTFELRCWRVLSSTNDWAEARLTMQAMEDFGQVAIMVVRDSAVDAHLRQYGCLPNSMRDQVNEVGQRVLAGKYRQPPKPKGPRNV